MSVCNLACGAECTKDTCPVFKAYQQGRADRIEEKTVLDIYVPNDNICCKEAYCRGRADALSEIIKALSIFNDRKNGNEHFIYGIETAKEIVELMKGK